MSTPSPLKKGRSGGGGERVGRKDGTGVGQETLQSPGQLPQPAHAPSPSHPPPAKADAPLAARRAVVLRAPEERPARAHVAQRQPRRASDVEEAPARPQRALAQVQVDRRPPKLAANEAAQPAGVALWAEPGGGGGVGWGLRGGVCVRVCDAPEMGVGWECSGWAGEGAWGGGMSQTSCMHCMHRHGGSRGASAPQPAPATAPPRDACAKRSLRMERPHAGPRARDQLPRARRPLARAADARQPAGHALAGQALEPAVAVGLCGDALDALLLRGVDLGGERWGGWVGVGCLGRGAGAPSHSTARYSSQFLR